MSIFDSILGIKEDKKIRSEEQSLDLIQSYVRLEDTPFTDISSHGKCSKVKERDNVYQFTMKLMSLGFLVRMGKDSRVKNIHFTSRHAGTPGSSIDSVSLRHFVIVEYE